MSSKNRAGSATRLCLLFLTAAILLDWNLAHVFADDTRVLSGVITTDKNEPVEGVTITVISPSGQEKVVSDKGGAFRATVPGGPLTLRIEGKYISPQERSVGPNDSIDDLKIRVSFVVPPIHNNLVIVASSVDPGIDRRNDSAYKDALLSRDDQIFHTLDAGINAAQHEGGGKSVEIRRFGFNLDHGGVSGGLKVLVDGVQQNQSTQAHGQGYLGALKSLTPELVKDVDILNGPFSAEYGDFSGLGVVHIRLKESLPDQFTARIQGGTFGAFRTFLAYSPRLRNADSFISYEGSRTDGPFQNPLRYKRNNLSGNYTRRLDENQALGFKFNFASNDFFSSGQIPLDQVAEGRLDRFGFVDPHDGGRVRSGTFGAYYRKQFESGDIFKLDGFLARSLFDLYSNFTFFLHDPVNGDGIQQHDSRLQEGANAQYLHPYRLFGHQALLTFGSNFHDNQINVGLYPRARRTPTGVTTRAHAHVTNTAGYAQQGIDLLQGRLHLEGGLRFDYFRFDVTDKVDLSSSGIQGASRFQPKANLAFAPAYRIPLTLFLNYGRGISSQDARGVVQRPLTPRISTTDFYQVGTSHHLKRFSLSTDLFLIDRSNEQVYIPDDGSFEFKGPSRAYGFEVKSSVQLTPYLAFNGGITRVTNAFYRGTAPRVYVDSAPHTVANAGLTLGGWRRWSGSLRYRHTGNYRLDGEDAAIRAAGLDVIDLHITKQLRHGIDFNLGVDNLTNKKYFETQNYFQSRLQPGDPVIARIHGTPGYPFTLTVGLTFHVFGK